MPGVPFHLIARIHGQAHLFRGIERPVAGRILAAPARSDASLLAYAVMPNHIHMVVLQGKQPLAALMQPLLRRIALLVQRRHGTTGHVFERPYRAWPCTEPDYFRNSIVYVHLNAVRADVCASVDDYEWCSHARYCALPDEVEPRLADPAIENVLRLFAAHDGQSLRECRDDYRDFLRWRCAMDAHLRAEHEGLTGASPEIPATLGGNRHWLQHYAAAVLRFAPVPVHARLDLRDFARAIIAEDESGMDLEVLRSGSRCKAVVRARRRFVLRALEAGYAGGAIARFLNVAPSTISEIRTKAKMNGR